MHHVKLFPTESRIKRDANIRNNIYTYPVGTIPRYSSSFVVAVLARTRDHVNSFLPRYLITSFALYPRLDFNTSSRRCITRREPMLLLSANFIIFLLLRHNDKDEKENSSSLSFLFLSFSYSRVNVYLFKRNKLNVRARCQIFQTEM